MQSQQHSPVQSFQTMPCVQMVWAQPLGGGAGSGLPCGGFPGAGCSSEQLLTMSTTTPASSVCMEQFAAEQDLCMQQLHSCDREQKAARRRGSRKTKKAAAAAAAMSIGAASVASYYLESEGSENDSGADSDCPFRAKWGDAIKICDDESLAADVMTSISGCDAEEQHALVSWLLRCIKPLAMSKSGTHVVQKLLEQMPKSDKERITMALRPCIRDLYESAHGNHVLAKIVEQLPSATVQFVVQEFVGNAREVARHQYGCRIMERLIEHCPDQGEMATLLNEVVADAEPLCRHPFGNFVVQHLLEHGSDERRRAILAQVQHKLPALAMHRTASHFVQQLLDYGEAEVQQKVVQALVHGYGQQETLATVAGSRYGSFVVEQLANLEQFHNEVRDELIRSAPLFTPAHLKFARRVIDRFELRPEFAAFEGAQEDLQ